MILKIFVKGPIGANNYLLIDENSNDAVLIDCSTSDEEFVKEIQDTGVNLKYILLTHGHFDHILGCNIFREKFGCDIYVGEGDEIQVKSAPDMLYGFVGVKIPEVTAINKVVKDGDVFKIGNIELKAISTPGHTQGGMCYLSNDGKLFSGDTLFHGSVGRTDLNGGDFNQIIESVREKLFKLPDDTVVYPGHAGKTSIKFEKQFNEINKF